ncbi:SRPBCC family protein [Microlunatus ginsengisoli]|uniref:SRPBCC family protein n=1 Tax=Microlunatus ginsengisoli TaxID=363863 RepID=A0ABP6ZPG5_9ACTN
MRGSVTVWMNAAPEVVWDVVSDVTRIGEFSPETFEAEWADGATGPVLGAHFRGHVKRNGIGPTYWSSCKVTACEPGSEFGFAVYAAGTRANNWHYRLEPRDGGTEVTESFELGTHPAFRVYAVLFGRARRRTNERGMRQTLERIKSVVEHEPRPTS